MQKTVCLSLVIMTTFLLVPAAGQEPAAVPISADAINAANLATSFVVDDRPYIFAPEQAIGTPEQQPDAPVAPNPAIVRAQVLLDQQGASPGVIDGYDGENVRKAVMAFQAMTGMAVTGNLDAQVLARLDASNTEASLRLAEAQLDSAKMALDETRPYAVFAEQVLKRFRELVDRVLNRFGHQRSWIIGHHRYLAAPPLHGTATRRP